MIIDFFLYIFYELASSIVGLLPAGTLNTNITSAFSTLWQKIAIVNFWIDFSMLFTVLGIYFATEVIIFTFHAGVFFYNKLRGSG